MIILRKHGKCFRMGRCVLLALLLANSLCWLPAWAEDSQGQIGAAAPPRFVLQGVDSPELSQAILQELCQAWADADALLRGERSQIVKLSWWKSASPEKIFFAWGCRPAGRSRPDAFILPRDTQSCAWTRFEPAQSTNHPPRSRPLAAVAVLGRRGAVANLLNEGVASWRCPSRQRDARSCN